MNSTMTLRMPCRFCILVLPLLLWWSGFSSAFAQASRALNLSTRLRVGMDDNIGIAGFLIRGGPKHVVIRALGPSLSVFGVPDVLDDPTLSLEGTGLSVPLTNDNSPGSISMPPSSFFESSIETILPIGDYTAKMSGNINSSMNFDLGIGLIEIYDLPPYLSGRLANISTRAFVGVGDDIVIAGFILGDGNGVDNIIVRGLGPSLADFNLPNVLADPTLELRDANGTLIESNDNWEDDPAQAVIITTAMLALPRQLESGIAAIGLAPGLYTALLSGLNQTTGLGLVEIYDGVP